jgi:hypothetical protein
MIAIHSKPLRATIALVGICTSFLMLASCDGPPADAEASPEVEAVQAAVTLQPPTKKYLEFTWDSQVDGANRVYLKVRAGNVLLPVTTKIYVCGLTKIWGNFDQRFINMRLGSTDTGTGVGATWFLEGNLQGRAGGMTARCVPVSNFSNFTGCYGGGSCMRRWQFGTSTQAIDMWRTDAINTLTGFGGGPFDGGAEWASVYPNGSTGFFQLQAASTVVAGSRPFAEGISTYLGKATHYVGRHVTSSSDLFWENMSQAEKSFCYLARFAGKFRGAESVEISAYKDTFANQVAWRLTATATGDESTWAEAECISY